MPFTRHATDLCISEKIAAVTTVGATDIAGEFQSSTTWVTAFGLCAILQNHPPEPHRQLALQFIRRVEMAFAEYSRAVASLTDLVGGGQGRWSPYYQALYYFEAAIAQLYLAYDNMRTRLGQKEFKSGDGSVLDRLNKVFNASKHQIAAAEQTVWLTNVGISANDGSVAFTELEDLLRRYGHLANKILNHEHKGKDAQQAAAADGASPPADAER